MNYSRRQLLTSSACGFGGLALGDLLCQEGFSANSLTAQKPHYRAAAKRVIFLFMQGGPSQMDMFDFKPALARFHGGVLPFSLPDSEATVGLDNTRLLGPVTSFGRQGQSGLQMTDLLPELAQHADDLCVLRGMKSDSPNHPVATMMLHTGTTNQTWPSLGAWVSYGLGTENDQLPSYLTILPVEGARNYGSAFLPAIHQGTPIQEVGITAGKSPIRHLKDAEIPHPLKRRQLDFLQSINRKQLDRLGEDQKMEGVIESMELAFRMQMETPKLVDFSGETKPTLDLYGIDQTPTNQMGRQCLLARRFAEAGVRFIQVGMGGWDHHGKIRSALPNQCAAADKPIAGLLADLKNRGLLAETLVVWAGEFGRTPHSQDLGGSGSGVGREHNPHGFTIWLAGGGVKGGMTYGETDDFGYRVVQGKVHIHDLHATILHLLGLDHKRLTYHQTGRDFRLTDVHGRVCHEILI